MKPNRYHLLDVLKLLTLFSIQTLHAWEFIFFKDDFLLGRGSIYFSTQWIARIFSLGGQVLVGLIFLFFGLTAKSRMSLLKVALFGLLGQVVLTLAFMNDQGFFAALEWDIYIFLSLSCVILSLIPQKLRSSPFWILLSLTVLWIPPTYWQNVIPQGTWGDILSGRLTLKNSGGWAPFPWFFHTLLFLSLGAYVRENLERFSRWMHVETFLWPILLVFCVPHLGHYVLTPIGPHYYSFNFNQSPVVYWSNFLPFVFWMRLSFLSKVQDSLSRLAFFRWLSSLAWSRHVGLTYLLAVLYVGWGSEFDGAMAGDPWLFDLFYLSIMPVVELSARGILWLKDRIQTLNPTRGGTSSR